MLLENENPEMSDLENQESVNQDTETPKLEESSTTEEKEAVKEENPEENKEVSSSQEETPESESEPVKKEDEPAQEENATESSEEAPVEEVITFDENAELIDESFPPMQEGLFEKVEELTKDRVTAASNTLDASVYDLIYLLDYYCKDDRISANIPKVGMVKRTFNALSDPQSLDNSLIARFKAALGRFNKKRSDFQKKQESLKAENSTKKAALLVELEKLVAKEDPLLFKEVRAIQDQWREIGHVLKSDIEKLYKEYRTLLDKFYKLREMHFELLDYDRRINLQEKERLIKEAEGLIPPEEDRDDIDVWREKMDMLSELQQKWKSIGHVPREDMERINNEYRAVIDGFFEVRQGFMEIQDQLRSENAEKKEEILTKMAEFSGFNADKPRAWNDATRTLREYQDAWKKIGQASQSVNSELWARYREICNNFFSKKSEFFKKYDEFRAANLVKKRGLVEQVEEMSNNTEWEKTAKRLKVIQKEWKQIGPVPERQSNKLWNRFRAACDAFFENRRSHYQSLHSDENDNLQAKKDLIEEAKKISLEREGSLDAAIAKIKELQATWKEVGRVPYKEKDKIWEEFRGVIDAFFAQLDGKRGEIRELKIKSNFSAGSYKDEDRRARDIKNQIYNTRRKLQKAEDKVNQYSINVQYISKGKSGDALRNQIQKEIDKEERLIKEYRKTIKSLNEVLKNPPKEEKPAEKEAPKAEPEVKAEAEVKVETETPEAEAPAAESEVETKTEEAVEETAEEKPVEEEAAKEEPAKEEPAAEAEESPKADAGEDAEEKKD